MKSEVVNLSVRYQKQRNLKSPASILKWLPKSIIIIISAWTAVCSNLLAVVRIDRIFRWSRSDAIKWPRRKQWLFETSLFVVFGSSCSTKYQLLIWITRRRSFTLKQSIWTLFQYRPSVTFLINLYSFVFRTKTMYNMPTLYLRCWSCIGWIVTYYNRCSPHSQWWADSKFW